MLSEAATYNQMGQIKLEVVSNFADSSLCPFLEPKSDLLISSGSSMLK
jgi:hypothetical protein